MNKKNNKSEKLENILSNALGIGLTVAMMGVAYGTWKYMDACTEFKEINEKLTQEQYINYVTQDSSSTSQDTMIYK